MNFPAIYDHCCPQFQKALRRWVWKSSPELREDMTSTTTGGKVMKAAVAERPLLKPMGKTLATLEAKLNARIMVTSDDEEILAIAWQYKNEGVIAYKRPAELATDAASTADVLIDAVKAEQASGYDPKTLVLLQPTSPLRTADDIRAALEVFREGGCEDTVVTVCEVDHPTAWVGTIGEGSKLEGIDLSGKRSQDYRKEYRLNGAVYVARTDHLLNSGSLFTEGVRASVMPRVRSLDIDESVDFRVCEGLIGSFDGHPVPEPENQ